MDVVRGQMRVREEIRRDWGGEELELEVGRKAQRIFHLLSYLSLSLFKQVKMGALYLILGPISFSFSDDQKKHENLKKITQNKRW